MIHYSALISFAQRKPLLYYLGSLFLFNSCTIALPEFQTAESLAPGAHKVAVGGFSGRGLNASTGGLLVHNYGITDHLDLTSNTSLSRLNIEQDLIATFDTLNNTFVVDSLGRTADSATLVIDGDSVITVIGATNAIDWSFDRQLINDFGQPVLDQLEASFNGNQKFKILRLNATELVLYFDEVIPVSIQGFTADMELRHMQYWQK
jgi:hypothetical protein